MSTFVFGWYRDEEDGQDLLMVSEKAHFEETGHMNDFYEPGALARLESILEELGCEELSESTYGLTAMDREEVQAALLETGEFESSEEFQEFLGE